MKKLLIVSIIFNIGLLFFVFFLFNQKERSTNTKGSIYKNRASLFEKMPEKKNKKA